MWMNAFRHVASHGGRFDCQHPLGDQFPGADTDDPHAQNPAVVRVEDEFG
jgi:hypothetical protein